MIGKPAPKTEVARLISDHKWSHFSALMSFVEANPDLRRTVGVMLIAYLDSRERRVA